MIQVPAFKANAHAVVIQGEGVLFLTEYSAHAFHGRSYEEVARLINGTRSADDIVDALAPRITAPETYYVLNILENQGVIRESQPEVTQSTAAFWENLGVDPARALKSLESGVVQIKSVGTVDPIPLLSALDSVKVRHNQTRKPDLLVVITDDYLQPRLKEINATALRDSLPWLLLRSSGPELWLGPLFIPGTTGCWNCLAERLGSNRPAHRFATSKRQPVGETLPALGSSPSTISAVFQMASVAISQFLAGADCGLVGTILSLNWTDFASQKHKLVKSSHCAACSSGAKKTVGKMVLRNGIATLPTDGGYRSIPPEKTFAQYENLISPITGVVSALTPVRANDNVTPVYVANHNHSLRINRLSHLKRGLRNASSGKGMSEIQAKVSALCEAVERFCGEHQVDDGSTIITASYADMRTHHQDSVIHPNTVMCFSEKQFQHRAIWNARGSKYNFVPEPLPNNEPIDWSPIWSLSQDCFRYLPTQLLYYGAPATKGNASLYSFGCSNGSASGNTLEEAVLQGFFELIERDAVALWWYNRLPKASVDIKTFDDPYIVEVSAHYRHVHQRETWALDITSDLDIPAFAAISRLTDSSEERLLFGFGCHLDARIALQRAYAEMNQMLTLARGDFESLASSSLEDDETLRWIQSATVSSQPYLQPDSNQSVKRRCDFSARQTGDFLSDIDCCRAIIETQGMEMLVLDQTRSDIGMPVVKVVIPGLRHFWARFGRGRLYDVPLKMKWLKDALGEDDLNPISVFF